MLWNPGKAVLKTCARLSDVIGLFLCMPRWLLNAGGNFNFILELRLNQMI